jgi:biopolymer transport protein TolR
MAFNVGGGGGVQSNINMTPMIDILLVLLIIFMAISPVHPKGLEALAPQPPPPNSPPPPENDTSVVISIDKQHNVKINQEASSWDGLEERLVAIFKLRNQRVVFIKGDPDLDYSYIAQAIDIAHGANIDKVGLMTPKVEAGQ